MARKKRDYKAEYARRIEATGSRRHWTKQQLRGHGRAPAGQEHRVRRERAIARGDLTEAQRSFAARQSRRSGKPGQLSYRSPAEVRATLEKFDHAQREAIIERQRYYNTKFRSGAQRRLRRRHEQENWMGDDEPDFDFDFEDDDIVLVFYK